jgi:hypothetical protein
MERVLRVFESFQAAEEADLYEWLALSPEERLMIGEAMRLEGCESDESGLQRVLRVVERSKG